MYLFTRHEGRSSQPGGERVDICFAQYKGPLPLLANCAALQQCTSGLAHHAKAHRCS